MELNLDQANANLAGDRQSVARKLGVGFGLLIVMLTASGVVSYWQIQRIDADLIRIVEIDEPLKHAVLEMEIHAGETARAVLHHIHQPNALFRRRAAAAENRLNEYAKVFDTLVTEDQQRKLGKRVASLYAEFKMLGDQLMDLSDRRQSDIVQLRADVCKIDSLLDEMLSDRANHDLVSAGAKLESALRMQIDIEQTFSVVEAYTLAATPAMHEELGAAIDSFREHAKAYESAGIRAENTDLFTRLSHRFDKAAAAAKEAVALTDKINSAATRFEADLEAMDRCLDHQIQPLIHEHTRLTAQDALQSSRQAVLTQVCLSVLGMIFGGGIGWYVGQGVIRPVKQLVRGASIIGSGKREHRIVLETNDEFGELASAFNGMVENLNQSADELLAAQQREERLRLEAAEREIAEHAAAAKTDALTQLANRRAFDEQLDLAHDLFVNTGEPISVVLFDVDRFKSFNDTYGHQAGDEVLRGVARTLTGVCDAPDFVARFGGEEFAIVMPGSTAEQAADKADFARQAIEAAEVEFEGQWFQVTASGGAAQLLADETVASLVKRADDSLYAAKNAGRNRVQWHDGAATHDVASIVGA